MKNSKKPVITKEKKKRGTAKYAVMDSEEKEGVNVSGRGLKLQWLIFIDEYIATGGNGTQAYLKAYPTVTDVKVAVTCASRLLSNANVRSELNNKLSTQLITEDWIQNKLYTLVENNLLGKDSFVAVKALELLSKIKGMLVDTKQIAFTGENPAIFSAMYSLEEKKAMDDMTSVTSTKSVMLRIIE